MDEPPVADRAAAVDDRDAPRREPSVDPRRRRWCSGSSIEIIIGSGSPCGRGARWLEIRAGLFSIERTSSCFVIAHTSFLSSSLRPGSERKI